MTAEMHQPALWPLALYLAAASAVVAAMLALSHLLGQRHMEQGTGSPYESGIVAAGPAGRRFDVSYYLVAMFFLVFDVESVFIFAWAIALREAGWAGYVAIFFFNAVLMLALVYLSRTGALDWVGPATRERSRHRARSAAPPRDDAADRIPAGGLPR